MGRTFTSFLGLALLILCVNDVWGQKEYNELKNLDEQKAKEKAAKIIQNVNYYDLPSQQSAYDSLEFLINYFRLDSFRITTYIKRGRYELLANQDVKKALQYFTNAKELAIQQNNIKKELDALAQIAQLYSNTNITDKAIETLMELKQKAEDLGDSVRISSAYFQLAVSSINPSDYSVQMFKKSLAYSPSGANNLPRIYGNLGHAYILKEPKNLDSAKYFLEIANSMNDSLRVSPSIPLTLSEVYILRGEYDEADLLIDQILAEKQLYDAYDFSLLSYYLKIRTLQHRSDHLQAVSFVKRGLDKINNSYFDDYEIVDFCRAAKKSLIVADDFDTYKIIDSIETSSKDSIEAYVENASISRSENMLEINSLEKELSQKNDEIKYKNIAILILGVTLMLVFLSIYQTYKKRQLKSRLAEEGQKYNLAEQSRKNLEEQKKKSDDNVTLLESKMVEKIQQQERQLASHVLSLTHKNNVLTNVLSRIQEVKKQNGEANLDDIEALLEDNLKNEDHWKSFLIHFENVHPGFYERLKEISKGLTKQDKRMLSYIKMQLTSKEIAQLLGVNYESVNTSRYRLRKKLNLPKDMELDDYITSL